jgi:hypothetical protein
MTIKQTFSTYTVLVGENKIFVCLYFVLGARNEVSRVFVGIPII